MTSWSLCIYIPYVFASIAYFTHCTIKDHPYSLLVETCSRVEPRTLSPWRIIALIIPNLLNFASLCTDILLVRFLHKTVLPTITLKLEKSNSNCKGLEKSISIRPEPEISTSNRQAYGHSEPHMWFKHNRTRRKIS